MALFHLNYENKTNLVFITAFIWVINFRISFKNIDSHMDTGCYASVKFDALVILIKNIICLFFIFGFLYERKITRVQFKVETIGSEKINTNDESSVSQLTYIKTEEEHTGMTFDEALNHTWFKKFNGRRLYIKIKKKKKKSYSLYKNFFNNINYLFY